MLDEVASTGAQFDFVRNAEFGSELAHRTAVAVQAMMNDCVCGL